MEPFGAQQFIFCGFVGVVRDEKGQHEVFTLLLTQEAVVVLPDVGGGAGMESFAFADHILLFLVLFPFLGLGFEEQIILIRYVLVFSEEAATRQGLHFGLRRFELQIVVLLLAHRLLNVGRHQINWQVAQGRIVARAEALRNHVLLLVRELVEKLRQVGQLVVPN